MAEKGTKVYVCAGDDCRKRKSDRKKLRGAVAEVATVVPVRCQKVCKGPVVGLEVDGTMQWFGKVRGKAARNALAVLVQTGDIPPELRPHRTKKRRGKLRT
jgi:hypothetical protein